MAEYRYFLKASWQKDYTEVTREKFIRAERNAGFRSTTESDLATGGFSSGNVSSKIEVVTKQENECNECRIRDGDYIKEKGIVFCSLHKAAPSMLEALEWLLKDDPSPDEWVDACAFAREVVARVKGHE